MNAQSTQTLAETASLGSGLATVYQALDHIVASHGLDDAALVLDLPGLGRQVLHAGRRPLGDDPAALRSASPGLYLDPPLPVTPDQELTIALGALALRYDARPSIDGGGGA